MKIDKKIKRFLRKTLRKSQSIDFGYEVAKILKRGSITMKELEMLIEEGFLD